jgi:hypothetical protein
MAATRLAGSAGAQPAGLRDQRHPFGVQRQVGQADRDIPPGVGAPAGKIVEQRLNAAVAARRRFISTAKAFSSAGLLSPSASTVGPAFVTFNPFRPLHTGSSHGW